MSQLKKLIIGLGNPGKEYELTRHNFGFLVVDEFARQNNLKFSRSNITEGVEAKGEIDGQETGLLKPATFMNNSGVAIEKFIGKKEISLVEVLVVCDDVNLGFGNIRIRAQGTAGGHNGLKSVIEHLKSTEFARLRLGVGSPKIKEEMVGFVLGEFNGQEKKELPAIISIAVDCCHMWLAEGVEKTMDHFNKRKEDE